MIASSTRRAVVLLTFLFSCASVLLLAQQFELPEPFATPSAVNFAQIVSRPIGAELQLPAGFSIEVFADNLQGPRNMVHAPNGDLFVAQSSRGSVVVLRDTDDDGLPDMRSTYIAGLTGVFGMSFHEGYLYLGATDRIVRVPYLAGDTGARGPPEQIASLPFGGHSTRNLIFSRDGSKMYVAVGSRSNKSDNEEEIRAAISEYNPDGSGHRIFASGLRNPVGLALHPDTGVLWTAVNERDRLGDDLVPDYMTSVQDGGFYGWPYSYIGTNPDPEHVGKRPDLVERAIVPDVLVNSHSAALGMTFYDGTHFPEPYRSGAFVALHGSWNRSTLSGYRVGFVPFSDGIPAGPVEDFVTGWILNAARPGRAWGRPVGVLVSQDGSLLVSDDGGDLIWRISFQVQRTTETTFTIGDRSGSSITTSGDADSTVVGYARIRPDSGNTTPFGVAIMSFRTNDVLVSEAGVPASGLVQSGRIYAEVDGAVNTGVAIANPNNDEAVLSFFFTDGDGIDFGHGTLRLGANEHVSKFLDEEPFGSGPSVNGTFTFTSSIPIAVIALRGFTNQRSEFLITTLPVAPLSVSNEDTIYMPHFADGAGWRTQVILINPTDEAIRGAVQFWGTGDGMNSAVPVTLMLADGQIGSDFTYEIPARSSRRLETSNPAALSVGSVRVVRDPDSSSPSGLLIFSNAAGGTTVAEAGVLASPARTAFRMYAEVSGTPGEIGSVRSGLAIANTSSTAATAIFELSNLDGTSTGLSASRVVPGSGHVSMFIDELFGSLTTPFQGVLRISSSPAPVAVVALRTRTNERGDFLITTTPPSDEAGPATSSDTYFPQVVDSGGWSTQMVLFSGVAGQASSGTLSFIDQTGRALGLSLLESR